MSNAYPPRQDHVERRLVEWFESIRGRAHVWGESDCVTLLRDAVDVICGGTLDVPEYADLFGARKVVKSLINAHGSLGGAMAARGLLGPFDPKLAQTGDLFVWEPTVETLMPCFAVLVGRSLVLSDEDRGVYEMPLHEFHATLAAASDEADAPVTYRVP